MSERENRSGGFDTAGNWFEGYTVYDQHYEKIGKVDDLFLDERDEPEYIGVKMGFLGARSTIIPMDLVRVNDRRGVVEVFSDKSHVKDGPTFNEDQEITADFERRVRDYYGLDSQEGASAYGPYYSGEGKRRHDDEAVDLYPGERSGSAPGGYADPNVRASGAQEHLGYAEERREGSGREGSAGRSGEFPERSPREGRSHERGGRVEDLGSEDELRVSRSEEELRAGVREREAGRVNVRKRVRTERERLRVPTRHEEVSVERVPASGEASAADIGEDEISVPVVEEEVVVQKRPVKKEEVRIRKDVVQDEQVVEEDVRKEEVEVDDPTRSTGRRDV